MSHRQNKKIGYLLIGVLIGYLLSTHFNGGKTETRYVKDVGDHVALERSVDMETFWDVWEVVNELHFNDEELADTDDRVEGAINGMLESLDDPYTVYMNPEDARKFEESLRSELEGIGAQVSMKDGYVTVVTPLKNSPAANAGLMPGDIIAEVDGESTVDMTLFEAVEKIKGPRGTKVLLSVARKGESEFLEFEITRQTIKYDSVTWEMKENEIAYIEVTEFVQNTTTQFSAAINDLLLSNPKGLIIDLRNNGGGYLDTSIEMLSEFTSEKKKAVIVKSKHEEENKVIYTTGRARLDDIPVVVLINEGSASAAEIMAGALKDWDRATLIGKTTFGKGTVQEPHPMDDGAILKVTIANWHTPSDHSIEKQGITPDIEVNKTSEDIEAERDPQLDCAFEYFETGSCSQEVDENASLSFF